MAETSLIPWYGASKRDPRAVLLYSRHYSCKKSKKTVKDWLNAGITPPGESMTLLTSDGAALFVWVWQRFKLLDQGGVNCAVFRNEAPDKYLSSELIREAERIAWQRWPGARLYTYVDGRAVHGDGLCFKKAGWRKLKERTKNGLIILEKLPV